MKRRGFFAALACLPFIGRLVPESLAGGSVIRDPEYLVAKYLDRAFADAYPAPRKLGDWELHSSADAFLANSYGGFRSTAKRDPSLNQFVPGVIYWMDE